MDSINVNTAKELKRDVCEIFGEIDTGDVLYETYGCGILDSGCSKSVCGVQWLNAYLDSLSDDELKEVRYEHSDAQFKFGNPNIYKSIHKVVFPAEIGSKKILITADVLETNIPLLISKSAMKKAKTVIKFETDEVIMFNRKIRLRFTPTGHYCITLNKKASIAYYEDEQTKVYFVNLEKLVSLTEEEKQRTAVKIHKQFCHASGKRLRKLLVDAGVEDLKMLKLMEDVSKTCDICTRYKKTPPKPVVTIPLAKVFNQHVAMDLKDIGQKKILHMIDHATRYSAACVVSSKRKEVIVASVLRIWVSVFGSPKKILFDNGGEFRNEDVDDMAAKLNTTITSTAAESPWSNGINERHNGILGEMVMKTMEDSNCSFENALMWSIASHNSLANVYGFAPNQLVMGRNATYPSVLYDKLPALENDFTSELVRENLNALHSARENFIKAESSEKLRRALR